MFFHSELGQLAVVALCALLCGIILARFKQPAIVGYILAGVVLGPSSLGLVDNRAWVEPVAELGVLLLLFVIAMKLSLRSFRTIWKVALMAALMQIVVATVITLALSKFFFWPVQLALLLGFVVSLSSTSVAIKLLEEIKELRSDTGRIVVGILIAQDLAFVPMLLLLNWLSTENGVSFVSIPILCAVIFLIGGLIWYLSRREKFNLPFRTLAKRHSEIVPLGALGCCLAAAAISDAIGLTAAFGAFIAGLAIGSTRERRHIIRATEPIQGVLAMIFFLSIGLLIDLEYIWKNIGTVLVLLILVLIVKSGINVIILRLLNEPWPRAFLAGILLSQLGEFSFVLASAGVSLAAIGVEEYRLCVAVIALSLLVSPIWLVTARRMQSLTSGGIWRLDDLILDVYRNERILAHKSVKLIFSHTTLVHDYTSKCARLFYEYAIACVRGYQSDQSKFIRQRFLQRLHRHANILYKYIKRIVYR